MIKLWLILGLVLTLTSLLAVIPTTLQSRNIREAQNILVQLSAIDEQIYFSMMMLQSGTASNFDLLSQLNQKHKNSYARLEQHLSTHMHTQFDKPLRSIHGLLKLKERQLEAFKSDLSVLNNAKIYVSEKMRLLSTSHQQLPLILQISSKLITFSESPSASLADQIRQEIVKIDRDKLSPEAQKNWDQGLIHLEYYLTNKITVFNRSHLTINWVDLEPYNIIRNTLEEDSVQYTKIQNIAYYFLVLSILVLSVVASIILKRYLSAQKALLSLNKSLEERIELATRDLEKSRDLAVKANAAKTSFLANMSHELRTPLNSIIGFSSRLEKKLANSVEKTSLSALKNIHTNGLYLLNFFNDLLELSRASEEENIEMQVSEMELTGICEGVIADTSSYFHRKQIELSLKNTDLVTLCNDPQYVKRIIYGVTNTAMHNTTQGSVVLELISTNDGCTLTITDTAKPLDNNKIAVLLNPFEQAASNEIKVEGIGLGLSLVTRMLDLMGGDINIQNIEGGNEYRVFLPNIKPALIPGSDTQ